MHAVIDPAERQESLRLLRAGQAKDAAALLSAALDKRGADPDMLGLLALALEKCGDKDAAIEAMQKAVDLPADTAITFRNACNLAAMLIDSGRRAEAIALLQRGWLWPAQPELEPQHLDCIGSLASAMNMLDLHDEAVALLLPLADADRLNWPLQKALIFALERQGKYEEALLIAQQGAPDRQSAHERDALLAYLYFKTGDSQSASQSRSAYFTAAPACLLPARPGQKYTVGVVEANPMFKALFNLPRRHHFTSNYPWMMAERQADRFRLISILVGAGPDAIDQFIAARPRVVINNVVNAEMLMSEANLQGVQNMLARLQVPVINPPEQAAKCTRQKNAQKLASVPGLVVPEVMRYLNVADQRDKIIDEIDRRKSYPLIIRSTMDQQARNMTLVHRRSELADAIAAMGHRQFYCIDYVGAPRRDNCFRRIRAAFIDSAPLIIRADYCEDWIVRSRNKIPIAFYRMHPKLLAEADAIVRHPEKELGSQVMQTLEAVGKLIPLDIFGMDFDVDDDGRVVFFEANASMNLYSNAPAELPYPPEAEQALKQAMEAALDRRAQ